MSDMSPYSRPGISHVDEQLVIHSICQSFGLKGLDWMTLDNRKPENTIPRQLLMACLMDFLQYSQRKAGAVCLKDHCTAYYSHRMIHETLMNDPEFGGRVRQVYEGLKLFKNGAPKGQVRTVAVG